MLNFKHLHYFYTVAKTGSITRAAEKLYLTPQTLSGQISLFEQRMKVELFKRAGRRLDLTEAGFTAMRYAEEIFQLGSELEQTLRVAQETTTTPFRVGIADVVPKVVAQQLLKPVLQLPERIKLICREDSLEHLLADLALHKLDMVLADSPLPTHIDIKGYSYPLLESDIAFVATPALAASLQGDFPACLNSAPLLLPSDESALRSHLLRWLERHEIRPNIIGEFDDTALMRAFGESGAGVFPMLNALPLESTTSPLVRLGVSSEIRERYFAISVDRKITHPALKAVAGNALSQLLS